MWRGDVPDVLEPGDPNGLTISGRRTTLPGPTSVRIEALLGLLPVRVIEYRRPGTTKGTEIKHLDSDFPDPEAASSGLVEFSGFSFQKEYAAMRVV